MLTPFLKYVSEGKVIRRHSDLQRFTFPEVTERIYLSFLALALMSQNKDTQSFVKSYADQTMAKGTFDQVRMINNDLANMLAIVSHAPGEVTEHTGRQPQEHKASSGQLHEVGFKDEDADPTQTATATTVQTAQH
jgi:hypothetical protein